MSWLAPAGLAWLSLLAPLIALYVLRPSRVEKVVSSTWLWSSVARELSARHPWQRLRPYLALLIQALALIAGALALARPSCGSVSPPSETVAIIVDASLSMQARDSRGTRLEAAARRAESIARGLGAGGRVLIIAAGDSPVQRLGPSSDAGRVRSVVATTPLFGTPPRFDSAVELAVARLRGARGPKRIVVITDGAVSQPLSAASGISTRIERVGDDVENTAIVAADVRAREGEPDRMEIFARVVASGRRAHEVDVVVSDEQGLLLASRRLRLQSGVPESVVASAPSRARADGAPMIVRIALTSPDGSPFRDAFPADDLATRLGPGGGRVPVLLAGDVPESLARGLRADARVDAFAVSKDAYARRAREHVPFVGLVVLGRDVRGPYPSGPSIIVSPDDPASFGLELAQLVAQSQVVTFDVNDPRMRFGAPEDVALARVRAVRSGVPLVTTRAGTAIASVRHREGEALVFGFDPDTSDLTREPAFVLFLHDTLSEAKRQLGSTEVADGLLGEPLRVRARGASEVHVRTPKGARISRPVMNDVAVVDVPPEPGVYEVEAGARTHRVVRALLDAEESNLAPRLTMRSATGAARAVTRAPAEKREWLPLLALSLLALILLDAAWARRQEAT